MIGQTRRGLTPPVNAPRRASVLVPSLWVINALLVGVVILAPVRDQASTCAVDDASQAIAERSAGQNCPAELTKYLGEHAREMQLSSNLVVSSPPQVTRTCLLVSPKRVVAHLEGQCKGGKLVVNLPDGSYQGQWVNLDTAETLSKAEVKGGCIALRCPAFSGRVILDLQKS